MAWRTNAADIVLPFIIDVVEFALFSVLDPLDGPTVTGDAQLEHVSWWFLAITLFCVATGFLLRSVQRSFQLGDYEESFRPAIAAYKRSLRADRIANAAVLVVSLTLFAGSSVSTYYGNGSG